MALSIADETVLKDVAAQLSAADSAVQQALRALDALGNTVGPASEKQIAELNSQLEGLRRQLKDEQDRRERTDRDLQEMRRRVLNALKQRTGDLYKAIGYQDPDELARQRGEKLKDLQRELHAEVERSRARGAEVDRLRTNEAELQEQNHKLLDDIAALNAYAKSKEMEIERQIAEIDQREEKARRDFYFNLLNRLGFHHVAPALAPNSPLQNSDEWQKKAEMLASRLIDFLEESEITAMHQKGDCIQLASEADLLRYKLPEGVPFAKGLQVEVVIPGFLRKEQVIAKSQVNVTEKRDGEHASEDSSKSQAGGSDESVDGSSEETPASVSNKQQADPAVGDGEPRAEPRDDPGAPTPSSSGAGTGDPTPPASN